MTAAQMVAALTREQACVLVALTKAMLDERTDAGAVLAWEELVGPQTVIWAVDWYRAHRAQRDREAAPTRSDLDVPKLLAAMPEALRPWAAGRLARPVFTSADDAREAFSLNLNLMRKRAKR